jgi:uroporphyrinogen-III synthase
LPTVSIAKSKEIRKKVSGKSINKKAVNKTVVTPNFIQASAPFALKNVLITQPKPEVDIKSPYYDVSKKYKINFDYRPFFEVQGIEPKEFRRYRINLGDYTAVIFTSRNSIDHFFRLSIEMKMLMSSETKYFCTSESIALYLQKFIQYRKRKVFYAEEGTTKDMLAIMSKHQEGEKYLLPCSEVHNSEIVSFLKDNKFDYTESVLYRTVSCEIKDLKLENYDMMIFFSPSGIEAVKRNFPKFKQNNIKFGGFGVNTCMAIKKHGFKVHLEAPSPGVPSMSSAIEHYIKAHR